MISNVMRNMVSSPIAIALALAMAATPVQTAQATTAGPEIIEYAFSDGTGGGKNCLIMDAEAYTAPDGTLIVFPVGHSTIPVTPEEAVAAYEDLPDALKGLIDTVAFADWANPIDWYWAREYEKDGLVSAASVNTERREVTFWGETMAAVGDTHVWLHLLHEAGHLLDSELGRVHCKGGRMSDSKAWAGLVKTDEEVSGEKSPSGYGLLNLAEDFAESVQAYYYAPYKFRRKFPNRADYLDYVLGGHKR